MHTDSTTVIVGIDGSKDIVDFFILNGKKEASGRRPRAPKALAKLAAKLVRHNAKQVVVIAVARKLLVALNAMARDKNTWIPQNA